MLAPRSLALTLLAATLSLASTLVPGTAAHGARAANYEKRISDAAAALASFTTDDEKGIPAELLARARGVAVIPNLIRGGFILGGRRGRGVLVVRSPSGAWSNPAMITLTGGSIGWQIGAESADLVLVFANDRSVHHIGHGKFTLGGDASAVAGPLGRHTTAALTGKAEVYAYFRSQGLYAGAAFEGARLDVDYDASAEFYAADPRAEPLGEQNGATPAVARRFLLVLEKAAVANDAASPNPAKPESTEGTESAPPAAGGAVTFPLGGSH